MPEDRIHQNETDSPGKNAPAASPLNRPPSGPGNQPPDANSAGSNSGGNVGPAKRRTVARFVRIYVPIIISIILAVEVGVQAWIYNQQRITMNEQRAIMDKQLDRISEQVNASQRQVDEMKNQSGTFDQTLKATQGIETSSQESAKAAQESAGITRQSFALLERPALGLVGVGKPQIEAGKPGVVQVEVKNYGHVPARNATVKAGVFAKPAGDINTPCPETPNKLNPAGIGSRTVIAANGTRVAPASSILSATPVDIDRIMVKKTYWVYVYVLARYGDKREYFFEYYARYNLGTEVWEDCGTHNRAN